MASLKLRRVHGSTESLDLTRSQPVTIGRQSFNDICVAEHDVAPMHCRVSWNKTGFEVTAATSNGVDVNMATVAHAMLKHGDTIRVGSYELIFLDEAPLVKEASSPDPHRGRKPGQKSNAPEKSHRTTQEKQTPDKQTRDKTIEELSLYEGPVLTESQEQSALESQSADDDDLYDKLESSRKPKVAESPLLVKPVRPGEQEILTSPLVLGLTGAGLTLLLITGIFWFLIAREQSNRLYDRAVAEMNGGQYSQAISTFEKFLREYPNHGLHRLAVRGLGKCRFRKRSRAPPPRGSEVSNGSTN